MARLQRLVRADLNRDGELDADKRLIAGRQVDQLHVDLVCVGALYRHLERADLDALGDFSNRISELLGPDESSAVMRSVEHRVAEVVKKEALPSFEARVTRGVIEQTADFQAEQLGVINTKLDRLLADREQPRVLFLDWVPDRRREELALLAESHADLVEKLDETMDPVEEDLRPVEARKLLEDRPSWLEDPPPLLLAVVTRFVEAGGGWSLAADAWEEVASLYGQQGEQEQEQESLLNAGVAAQLAGEEERRFELLDLVRSEQPDHPRLLLEDANRLETGPERLELLKDLDPDKTDIKVLLACHRGLAHLLNEDLEASAKELEAAKALDADRVQVRLLRINVSIELGRRAIRQNLRLPVEDLRTALADAQTTRDALAKQSRWDEAMRCLMLAADATFLVDGPQEAGRVLASIRDEELDVPDAPAVMGEVALRAQVPLMALAVTAKTEESNVIQRIRASAKTRLEPAELDFVLAACHELEDLAKEPGLEGEMAAMFRLLACLHHDQVPWHQSSEDRLERPQFKESALGVKALFSARDKGLAAADAVIEAGSFVSERVKAECLFQCAFEIEDHGAAAKRARHLLEVGTDQINRHLCAIALEKAGDTERARAEAQSLIDDPAVPTFARREMYYLLTKIAMDGGDLSGAGRAVDGWLSEFPTDDKGNWLRVQIASRRRRGS